MALLALLASLLVPCQMDRMELVWAETLHRFLNHTSAQNVIQRLRTSARCPITPGLNSLASDSCAHTVSVRTQPNVVWPNTSDTSTIMQPGIGVRLAGKASPFARTITVILQPIRVSKDMFVPCD